MITEPTRRDIFDFIIASGMSWSGRLNEMAFLSRLYDLDKLPSYDHRFRTASGDIWKHRVVNSDWDDDWVFYDRRFNLLHSPEGEFLRFLCEMVHPVVRPDLDEAKRIVDEFNHYLSADGWELFQRGEISGRPVWAGRKTGQIMVIFEEPTGWPLVDRQMAEVRARLQEAVNEEHYQAVGLLCREVLISVAQAVYDPKRHLPLDGTEPSRTDAKRMLESFLAVELGGNANEEARGHAKAALRLALALQHNRTADFKTAALCAEATASVVNILGVLSGARVPHIQI